MRARQTVGRPWTPAVAAMAATVVVAASGTPVSAQLGVGIGTRVEAARYADSQLAGLRQIALAVSRWNVALPIGSSVAIGATGGWAIGRVEDVEGLDPSSRDLRGLLDTGVSVSIRARRALLRVAANVPTGATTLSDDQLALSGILAAGSLPFSMASWGAGARIATELALDLSPATATRITVLGGYQRGQPYEPLSEGTLEYRPGDAVTARLAMEQYLGAVSVSLGAGWWRYGSDEVRGVNLFDAGDRLLASGTVYVPVPGGGTGAVWGSWARRARGRAVDGPEEVLDIGANAPVQSLWRGGLMLRWSLAGVVVIPEVDGRLFRRDDGVSEGYLYGGGLSLEIPVIRTRRGAQLRLVPSMDGMTGRVENRSGRAVGAVFVTGGLELRWSGAG